MKIVGYHIEDEVVANSEGEYCIDQPFVDFLLEPKPQSIKVFYHMGHSVAKILRRLGVSEEQGKWLQRNGELRLEPYLIKHRAGKFMSVKKGHYFNSPFANFGDMNQYEPARVNEKLTKDMIGDCVAKAKAAKAIGEEVYKALESVGLHPTSLTSPVNAYDKQILSKAGLPTIDDMPEEAGHYAYECCQGSWLEAYELGHWEQAWDYDINSAYPAELARLLDIRQGEWVKSSEWIEESAYGFCKGIVTINSLVSPVIFSGKLPDGEELNYTPTGKWERVLSKKKVQFIKEYGLGDFELIDGWWWVPKGEPRRVLASLVEQLYMEKERSKDIRREVIKRTMSGIWGKFLQAQEDGFGDLFNPVYGAEVESNVRIEVARFVLENKIKPIHISVDGVLSPKPVELNNGVKRMGRWELTEVAPCICVGTGTVAIKGKKGAAEFSIDYDWLLNKMQEEPEAEEYSMSKLSPVTLAVALNGNWEKLGELREVTKKIHVGEEVKRYYREKPRTGGELLSRHYESEPWDTSLVNIPLIPL